MAVCCGRYYYLTNDLYEHYGENHYWCGVCKVLHKDREEEARHNTQCHDGCYSCNKPFYRGGENALHNHNLSTHADRYCRSCRRMFISAHNFQQHMRSSVHVSKDIQCPMKGCGMTFTSPAALALHLDQGNCVSGMNHRKVNEYVVRYDRNNVITNPSRLIAGSSGESSTTYVATSRSWNGQAYECYLCNREFSQLNHLNQHLNSPRHQQKIYRCPRSDCRKEFSTLSAIMQHVESKTCEAYRFREVKELWKGLNSNLRTIAYY